MLDFLSKSKLLTKVRLMIKLWCVKNTNENGKVDTAFSVRSGCSLANALTKKMWSSALLSTLQFGRLDYLLEQGIQKKTIDQNRCLRM